MSHVCFAFIKIGVSRYLVMSILVTENDEVELLKYKSQLNTPLDTRIITECNGRFSETSKKIDSKIKHTL